MGLVDNKIIKIGHFVHNVKCVSNISRYLNLGSDSIIILKTNNIEKFLSKSSYLPKLDLIIIEDLSKANVDNSFINTIHSHYPYSPLLYISQNENVVQIIKAIEYGVSAYIPPSYFKFFFTKHLNSFLDDKKLFLPILFELKIALYYYPPTKGHYQNFGLTQDEERLLNAIYQGLSLIDITNQFTPQKKLRTVNQIIDKLYNKINLQNSISTI